jgi:hypothetical protein
MRDNDVMYVYAVFWSVVVVCVTIVLCTTFRYNHENKVAFLRNGLQECRDIGSTVIVWQKECRK